jgi:hypothetical protein
MKKIFAIIFAVCAMAVMADPPALQWGDYQLESKTDTSITTIDTVGLTTSQTLTSTRRLKESDRGWNYVLVNKTITGANAANTELIIKILVYNSSGTLLATHVIDTIVGAASQTFHLPFHTRCIGDNYSITLTGGGANGAEVITNGFQINMFRVKR